MHPLVLATGVWLVQAPPSPGERASEAPLAVPVEAEPPASAPAPSGDAGFFGADTAGAAPPAPGPPPMPEIEQLPARPGPPPAGDRFKVQFGGARDRKPVAGGGAGFFDPGKLGDEATGGGNLQIRGYLGFNFAVAQRTDISMRDPATGTFNQLRTLPYFGGGAANVYLGAPVYADVVYVRIAFEFISIPRTTAGAADVSPAFNPVVLMESAAIEVNPFAWASRAPRWFREGFKVTGGVFVVPFGLEDEEHDAPVRWWATRPLAMSAGRVYPGTWIDIGAMIKWKPTFGRDRPVRPIELDLAILNGDACTQTRSNDLLYRYQPVGNVDEACEHRLRNAQIARGDGSVLGIAPDNNGNKSLLARLMVRPVAALNLGGSFVWGRHPQSELTTPNFNAFVETRQAVTWRAGAHLDLNLDEVLQSSYPLPHMRGELVYGVDAAAPQDPSNPILADRRMLGGYAQVAQPLWRRKKTRLPGLILQYRYDYADPDRAVPGRGAAAFNADFADEFRYDEALQAHVVGLRFPVLPRFTLKAEYTFLREEGGRANRLANDSFQFQAVADF